MGAKGHRKHRWSHKTKSILKAIRSLLRGRATQPDPIQWTFTAQKTIRGTYRVYVTALITYPWRLYSGQSAPEGPLPTRVEFEESAAVQLLGKPEEMGMFKEEFDTKYQVRTRYYSSGVSFVQEVWLAIRPASAKGRVIFAACTEKQCREPEVLEFQVALNNIIPPGEPVNDRRAP